MVGGQWLPGQGVQTSQQLGVASILARMERVQVEAQRLLDGVQLFHEPQHLAQGVRDSDLQAIAALEAHWADRELDFSFAMADLPLLSPLVTPPTSTALRKHLADDGGRKESGFSPDGLYQVIKTGLRRIAQNDSLPLTPWERAILIQAGPHAFRHTFGTQAVASEVPLDIVQHLLGHASLQTTTIYVRAEKVRSIQEMGKFFRQD